MNPQKPFNASKSFRDALQVRKPDPLEKDIEKAVCDHAKQLGCLVYKFTSPSRRSVPDRLFILPDGKGVFFIEFKRRGGKPTPGQEVEIAKIREKGIRVFVVDNKDSGKRVITNLAKWGLCLIQTSMEETVGDLLEGY